MYDEQIGKITPDVNMELLSSTDETLQANHQEIQSGFKNGDTMNSNKNVNRCSHLGSASFSPFGSKVSVNAHKLNYVERVVLEMIETERMYVQDLRSIVEDYLGGIIDKHELPMKPEQVSALFGNIEDIYELNSRLLQDLDNCGEDPVAVASCFVEKSHYFDIYTQYCNNYPNSVGTLTECMRNKVLAKFFRERQEMLRQTLPLGSYLLKPVQRILKYHLLLQEIAKHFDVNIEGYEVVEEAIETMTGVACYINDMKRKHEHAVRQQEIQSLLLNWKGLDLTTYGELVLEGTFRVQRARSERTFFLFDKALLIAKKRGDHFAYKTHIPCSHLMLIESTRDSLCFTLTHYKNSKQQHNVQAKTVEEKHLWTHHIKKLILENHPAIIPQKAKEAILEMDAMYRGRYKYSPERLKKTMSVIDPTTISQQSERRQSVGLKMLDETEKSHSESEVYIGGMICTTGIALEAPLAATTNQSFEDGSERYSDVSKPLENGIIENAEDIKTFSSEEDEEETNILESSSILPSSVLDQASVIAERFINNLSRRSSLALEDGKGISYIAPRLSSRSSSLMNLNCMDKSLCQNESSDFPKSHQVVLPICGMVYAESSLSKVNSAENVFDEKDRSISRQRESILSFQDRQLIDKVKTYYDKAEYQDASFSIKRRESLAYIPAGVVKNTIFKINSLPRYNKSSRRTIEISSSSSDSESEPLTTYEDASSFEEKRGTDCSTLRTPFHATFSKGEILEMQSPVSEEAFKCSSEMIKMWEEIEKEESKNTNNGFIRHPGKPLISIEPPVDPHDPLIILEECDFGDIKEECQHQTPDDLSLEQLRSHCTNVSFDDQEYKTPIKDHLTLMELASHMDVNLSDNITNRVYLLARQYSQRIKCNKPVPYRRLKEIEDDMRRGSLLSVKEEKIESKCKLKTVFSFPMSDHIVSQEHSLTPVLPSEKSPKRLSFHSADSPDNSSPLKSDCRSPLSPVITENFHWPDVRELRCRYTSTAGASRDLPVNRSQSAPDKMMDHNVENVTDAQDKDYINYSYEKNIHHSYPENVLTQEKNLFGKTYIQGPNMTVSTQTLHNGNSSQTIDDCYYISAEAPLENNEKVIIVEKIPAACDVDDTYVHIRSPTTREKISIKAVIERCKAYQDSEVYKMREDIFNSEGSTGIRQDQSKPKVLSSNDTQQNRVKNLREKFQTLNSRVIKPSEFI